MHLTLSKSLEILVMVCAALVFATCRVHPKHPGHMRDPHPKKSKPNNYES